LGGVGVEEEGEIQVNLVVRAIEGSGRRARLENVKERGRGTVRKMTF